MRRHLTVVAVLAALGMASDACAQIANPLFQENFNGLTLGPSVNERRGPLSFPMRTVPATDATTNPIANAFSHTGPAGWTVDNNFDNFGNIDLTNAGGTPVFDATVPAGNPPVQLFKLGQVGVVVGNAGVLNKSPSPNDGVDEWEGWSIARKDFWSSVDDQDRSKFTFATGNVAVADSDEYDDLGTGRGGGYYNTGLTTAPINIAGKSSLELKFDSAWRAESYDDDHTTLGYSGNNQTAIVWATFFNGTTQVAQDFLPASIWDSDSGHTSEGAADKIPTRPASATFKADNVNEHVTHSGITVPAGANNVKFTFGYINAGNDWFWAIDNLSVSDGASAPFWTENFDAVPLGPSVNERQDVNPSFAHVTALNNDAVSTPRDNSFTHTTPAGWSINNAGIKAATLGDNNLGVYEWEGWSFTTKDFSVFSTQGDVGSFAKGDGVIAIADSDEFDDLGRNPNNETPNPDYTRPMSTVLQSPAISLAGVAANTLAVQFDSAWRWEGAQKAQVTVDFGSGEVPVLQWDSTEGSPNFHADNLNETVLVKLNNPAGATSAVVRFKYLDGSNNWFWAIDNVKIGVVPEPTSLALITVAALAVSTVRRRFAGTRLG